MLSDCLDPLKLCIPMQLPKAGAVIACVPSPVVANFDNPCGQLCHPGSHNMECRILGNECVKVEKNRVKGSEKQVIADYVKSEEWSLEKPKKKKMVRKNIVQISQEAPDNLKMKPTKKKKHSKEIETPNNSKIRPHSKESSSRETTTTVNLALDTMEELDQLDLPHYKIGGINNVSKTKGEVKVGAVTEVIRLSRKTVKKLSANENQIERENVTMYKQKLIYLEKPKKQVKKQVSGDLMETYGGSRVEQKVNSNRQALKKAKEGAKKNIVKDKSVTKTIVKMQEKIDAKISKGVTAEWKVINKLVKKRQAVKATAAPVKVTVAKVTVVPTTKVTGSPVKVQSSPTPKAAAPIITTTKQAGQSQTTPTTPQSSKASVTTVVLEVRTCLDCLTCYKPYDLTIFVLSVACSFHPGELQHREEHLGRKTVCVGRGGREPFGHGRNHGGLHSATSDGHLQRGAASVRSQISRNCRDGRN